VNIFIQNAKQGQLLVSGQSPHQSSSSINRIAAS